MKIFYIVLLLFFNNVYAITYEQFIIQLNENNPFFLKNSINTNVAELDKKIATKQEKWQVNLNLSNKSRDNTYVNSPFHNELLYSAKAIKKMRSGSEIQVNHTLGINNFAISNPDNKKYSQSFFVDYVYPVKQNAGGINYTLDEDIAKFSFKIEKINTENNRKEFIKFQLREFIKLAFLQEKKKFLSTILVFSKEQLRLVNKKFKSFLVDYSDVLKQQELVLQNTQLLEETINSIDSQKAKLSIVLYGKNNNNLTSEFDLFKKQQLEFSKDKLKNYHIFKKINLSIKQLKRQLISAKNMKKPKLDFNFGIGITSNHSSFSNLITAQSPEYKIGISYVDTLDDFVDDYKIEKIQLKIKQLKYEYQYEFKTIYAKARSLLSKLSFYKTIIHLNKERIKVADEKIKQQREYYDDGKGTLNDIIISEKNKINIHLSYLNSLLDYQLNYLDLGSILNILKI